MKYRADVDGLRTVAVLPVIFYHFGSTYWGYDFFTGGFLGVDVFFVISGYLITSIIFSGIDNKSFSYANFYNKRIRRILPSLFIVMALTSICAWYVLRPDAMIELGQSGIASIFFSSNIFFWMQDSYISEARDLKPLLHTWSLSVEEQFYIILPPFLAVVAMLAKKNMVKYFVLALVILSFLSTFFFNASDPDANFYLIPSRLWELGIGSLLAISLSGNDVISRFAAGKSVIVELLMLVALIALGYVFLTAHDTTFHPGPITMVPVLATAAILVFGQYSKLIAGTLSQPVSVFIGKISYTLYLVHWPIMVFLKNFEVLHSVPGFAESHVLLIDLICLILTFIISVLIYYIAEKPLRYARPFVVYSFVSVFFVGLMGFFAGSLLTNGYLSRYNVEQSADDTSGVQYGAQLISTIQQKKLERRASVQPEFCHVSTKATDIPSLPEKCINGKDVTIIVGDSHGHDLYNILSSGFPEENVAQYTGSNCGGRKHENGYYHCQEYWASLIRYLNENKSNVKRVIFTAHYIWWVRSELPEVEEIKSTGVPVDVWGPGPVYHDWVKLLETPFDDGRNVNDFINAEYYEFVKQSHFLRKRWNRYLADENIKYVDKFLLMCPEYKCEIFNPDGTIMFVDGHHISMEMAKKIGDRLKKQYGSIAGIETSWFATAQLPPTPDLNAAKD